MPSLDEGGNTKGRERNVGNPGKGRKVPRIWIPPGSSAAHHDTVLRTKWEFNTVFSPPLRYQVLSADHTIFNLSNFGHYQKREPGMA